MNCHTSRSFFPTKHTEIWDTRERPFSRIIQKTIRIGFTATPCRLSGENLGDIYQVMVQGPNPHELIQQKFLCDFITYSTPSLLDLSDVKITAGDFNKSQLSRASNKKHITGDAIFHWRKYCEGMQTVIFAVSIQHAIAICKEYNDNGIPSNVIHSKLSDKILTETVKSFVNRDQSIN